MGVRFPSPALTDDLLEHVAAGLHTLVRSWHYDLEAGDRRAAPAELDPQPQPTAAGGDVDIANTAWEDLPEDWREEFRDLAAAACREVSASGDLEALEADGAFLVQAGAALRRPWMADLPRVIVAGRVQRGVEAAGAALLRGAIHVIAAFQAGWRALGTVHPFPPPVRAEMASAGGSRGDAKHASFRVVGQELDPAALTALTGLEPRSAIRRGDLRVAPDTGEPYSPYRAGVWSVSSEDVLDPTTTTPEDHLVWLLDRLEPVAGELRSLIGGLEADFFVFFGMEQFNSSWEVSAATLRRIADLGASLSFDVYSGHS